MVSIAAAVTGLLLTGMVAFALAAGTATPNIDAISTVVTDRPVGEPAAATPVDAEVPAAMVVAKPANAPAVTSGFASRLITAARRNIRAGVSSKPVVVPRAIVIAPRPEAAPDVDNDEDDDREVITPEVRDDTDDADGTHDDTRQPYSSDRPDDSSKPAFHEGD